MLELDTHVPGAGAGDNLSFLWNAWWARFSADHGALAGFFHTDRLFAPFGASLVLHTHTALEAVIAGVVLHGLPIVRAHNLVSLAGLAANGFVAYRLAWTFTRRVMPAVAAGTSFATCAYLSVHLLGHVNLTHAWVLPLACLAWTALIDDPGPARGVIAALAFAVPSYTDYYYVVYAALFAGAWTLISWWDLVLRWDSSRAGRPGHAVAALAGLFAALAAAIHVTSGIEFNLGPLHVSALHARNPTSIAGVLALVWLALHVRPAIMPVARPPAARMTAGLTIAAVACVVLVSPVLLSAFRLMRSGDYVTQQYFWRSAPRGVDLATFVLGPPMHALTGERTTALLQSLRIDRVEQVGWLGIVITILLLAAVWRREQLGRDGRRWLWIAALFLVWSLGPSLGVAGQDTGILLPQSLSRYVPLVSNARMPGRAIVMVQLAACVLAAMMLTAWSWRPGRCVALVAAILLESASWPFPMYAVPQPDGIDALLRNAGDAAIVELPSGVRDGFGEWGRFDHRALVHQMAHGQRLAGGFAARVPPSVVSAYRRTPVLAALFDWSEGGRGADALPADLRDALRASGITYVVVETDMLSGLGAALERRGLHLVRSERARELFAVD